MLDPELPVVTIDDLGILRDVTEDDQGRVHVQITPTYSGCPAMETIRTDLIDALTGAGYLPRRRRVRALAGLDHRLDDRRGAQPSSTAYGIAPPAPRAARRARSPLALSVRCPQCGSARHPRVQPVRLDGLQVAVGLPTLPRAVRPLQGPLRRPDPMARTGFHPLRVAAIDELTDDAVAITFEVPDDLRDDYAFAHGPAPHHPRRRRRPPQLLDLHAAVVRRAADRREAAARAERSARPSSTRCEVGDELEVMTPAGRFTTDARPHRGEDVRRRSPPAPASPRCCRSSPPCSRASRARS